MGTPFLSILLSVTCRRQFSSLTPTSPGKASMTWRQHSKGNQDAQWAGALVLWAEVEFSRRRGSFGETEQQPIISFWWSLRKWSWPSQLVNKGGARESGHGLVQEMFRQDINRNSGIGCVERLFCFHPWRFPESSWVPEKQWVGLEMFWRPFCPWSYHFNSS